MKIYAGNPILNDNPNTALTASVAAGVTSLPIYNNAGFSLTTNVALLGQYNDEQAEIVYGSSTTSSAMALSSGTIYPHPQDTSLTLMTYDQVEFSRSDDGGTTWTVLSTTGIQVNRNSTVLVDTNGQSSSLWRFRFKNSVTSVYSSYSYSLGQSGYYPYQLEKLQDRVISLFQDPNLQILSYDDVTDWTNECSEILATEVASSDKMGLIGYQTGTVTNGTITFPDDFFRLKRISLSYDNGNSYTKATPVPLGWSTFAGNETSAFNQFSNTQPVYYRQDASMYFYPNNPTNYKIWYYRLPTYLINPQDKLDLVFRPYTSMYVDYNMYRAKMKDKKPNEAGVYLRSFTSRMERFIEQLTIWQLDEPDVVDTDDFDGIYGTTREPGSL